MSCVFYHIAHNLGRIWWFTINPPIVFIPAELPCHSTTIFFLAKFSWAAIHHNFQPPTFCAIVMVISYKLYVLLECFYIYMENWKWLYTGVVKYYIITCSLDCCHVWRCQKGFRCLSPCYWGCRATGMLTGWYTTHWWGCQGDVLLS